MACFKVCARRAFPRTDSSRQPVAPRVVFLVLNHVQYRLLLPLNGKTGFLAVGGITCSKVRFKERQKNHVAGSPAHDNFRLMSSGNRTKDALKSVEIATYS